MNHYREIMSSRSWSNSNDIELASNRKDLPQACLPNLFVVFPSLPGKKIIGWSNNKRFNSIQTFVLLHCHCLFKAFCDKFQVLGPSRVTWQCIKLMSKTYMNAFLASLDWKHLPIRFDFSATESDQKSLELSNLCVQLMDGDLPLQGEPSQEGKAPHQHPLHRPKHPAPTLDHPAQYWTTRNGPRPISEKPPSNSQGQPRKQSQHIECRFSAH